MIRTTFWLALLCVCMARAASADIMATFRLQIDDLAGNPIASVPVGGTFYLDAFVQDVRNPPVQFGGVFSAYADISLDSGSATAVGPITFSSFFNVATSGSIVPPGDISGVGGSASSLTAPGNAAQFLFRVPYTADAVSTATLTPHFDTAVGHEVLVYLRDDPLLEDEVSFTGASINIVPEPSSLVLSAAALAVLGAFQRRRCKR